MSILFTWHYLFLRINIGKFAALRFSNVYANGKQLWLVTVICESQGLTLQVSNGLKESHKFLCEIKHRFQSSGRKTPTKCPGGVVSHLYRPSDKIIGGTSNTDNTENIEASPSIPEQDALHNTEERNGRMINCASTRPDITEFPISGGRKTKQHKKASHAVMRSFKRARSRYFRYFSLILLIISSKRQIGRATVFYLQN